MVVRIGVGFVLYSYFRSFVSVPTVTVTGDIIRILEVVDSVISVLQGFRGSSVRVLRVFTRTLCVC